jgi:glycosyltransferase involved in cell wall biosynthesis
MTRQLSGIDRIVAISRFIEERLLEAGHDRSRVVYIPNGVPGLEERQPTPPSRGKEILFLGRIVHNKGLRELTRAVREIADPELRLTVAGDGELLPTIRHETRNDPRIRYLGWLDPERVAECYRSCRMVVVPSLWHEVMNTVVCEAQSWSRPVVATRVGGNEDLIADGVSGILCPPGDIRALRQAIVRLLGDDDLSAAIGRAGFDHVQQYGMRRHIDAIEELYRGLGHAARAPRNS